MVNEKEIEIGNLSDMFPKETITTDERGFVKKIKGTNDSGELFSVYIPSKKITHIELDSDNILAIKLKNGKFLMFHIEDKYEIEDAETEFKD